MNKVILMGRLTRDPEVRYQTNGDCIAKISIAVDRRYKKEGGPEADFFSCTAFKKTGEFIEKYLAKGSKVVLTGTIQNDNYTNGHGEKVYSVSIIIEDIEFAESKKNQGGSSDNPQPSPSGDGFMNIPDGMDDELPFA